MRPIQRALLRIRTDRLADTGLRRRDDEGFGMIDCIVAMVVLLAVLVPTGYLFTNVLSQAASARQRITALSVAEQWIETLNNQGPADDSNNQPEVGNTFTEPSSTLSGIVYSVSARFKWTDATGGTPDFCTTAISPVLGLQVTVSWGLGQSITDQAILNFPASGNLTDGYLAIQVDGDPAYSPGPPVVTAPNDASSTPWTQRVTQHVPVQVSGANLTTPYSLTPDATGCVFLQLSPGTYTVQVGPSSGASTAYVANYNESSSETQALSNQSAITVTDAEITQVVFQYDEGANVALAYPSTTVTDDGIFCSTNAGPMLCLAAGQTASSSSSPSASPEAAGLVQKSTGWSVATFPSTMTRVQDADCTTTACIAVGYSSSGAAAAISTNGTTWTNSALGSAGTGVTDLTDIECPLSATTPACLAIGAGGVLLTATISGSTATWTKDTLTGATALSQIVCPSSAAQPICFVTGTTASGATIFSNTGSAAPGTTWHAFTQSGVTMSTISSITCTSTTWCAAIGTASSTPEVITITSDSGTTVTWKPFTTSGFTMSTFNSVACYLSGGHDFCWASGTGKIGSGSVGPIVIYCNNTTGSICQTGTTASGWKNDTVPAGLTGISSLTCPSTATACFALDTTSTGPGVLSLPSGTAWSSATLPSGALSLSTLACPTATACYALGASATMAIVDVLSSGSWSTATFTGTTGGNPVYLSALVCTAATTCEVAGATESAAQVFNYTSSTIAFDASGTPTSLTSATSLFTTAYGMYLDNPPIMVSNSNLQPNTTIEMSAPTTANGPQFGVGPLFPFESGYSIAAGYCASELTTASVTASTVPGASSSTTPSWPTVILPMGLLPIEATNAAGTAVLSGAQITIADASCTSSLELSPLSSGSFPVLSSPPSNPSNPTSYTLPTTGVDGLSRIAVIYGTYQVTVTSGATNKTTTVTVNPTSIVVGGTTYYNPAFVPLPD